MKLRNTLYFIILLCNNTIFAQDTHYWTNQFGPRGSILGNAIIGGVKDNSSIFYNPGYLALVDSNNISISASIYQYDMLKIKDGAGKGFDLKSNQSQILPSLVSGTYQFKNLSNHKFGYTILTKNQTGIKTSSRIDRELNVIADYNNMGNEEFIGQFGLKTTLNEQWFGGCYSYKFTEHFSIGFTAFAAYRNQTMEYSYTSKVILPTESDYGIYITPLVAYSDIQSVEMSTVRGIGKIGLALGNERIDFGLTITTPSLPIYGSTTIQRDELFSNMNLDDKNFTEYTENTPNYTQFILAADSFRFDLNLNTFAVNGRQSSAQDKIETVYKSPLSIAAGIVFKSKSLDENSKPKRKFFFSFEYFNSINPYYLVKPQERGVIRPLKDNYNYTTIDFMGIMEAPINILNIAIGYERSINKKINLLASFRTNNSFANVNKDYTDMAISQSFWNLWHYSLGAIYKKERSDISIGISYCDGFGQMQPYVVMTNPSEKNFLQGNDYITTSLFRSFSFSIGYNYYLKSAN
jgi:hypothetical protein